MNTHKDVHKDVIETLRQAMATSPELAANPAALARRIREGIGVVSDHEVLALLRQLRHDTTGVGPLEALLSQPGVTDVVVNGPQDVFIDRGNGLERAQLTFVDDAEVRRLATRLAISCGARLDDAQPFADARLSRPDGTALRLHAVLSPPADNGTCLSLRVLRQASTSLDDLCGNGTIDAQVQQIIRDIVASRTSFLVLGGTGSGKTTLLSALLSEVDESQRIVVIEDTAELRPDHPHVVGLVARRANAEGGGEITMAQLLRQALRMRPDRIVVGEIRGAEVCDLLAALNTGHDGGAGTIHANSLSEVPSRMEALAALGGLDRVGLHSQLASAVDVVLTMHRGPDGVRRLEQIGLLTGNPVKTEEIWSRAHGAGAGWDAFVADVARRAGRSGGSGRSGSDAA